MKKNKKILLSLGSTIIAFGPLAVVVACGDNSDNTKKDNSYRHKLIVYREEDKSGYSAVRAWDLSMQNYNMVSRTVFEGITSMLFRTDTNKESDVSVGADGKTVVKRKATSKLNFDAIKSARIDVGSTKGIVANDIDSLEGLLDKNVMGKSISFTVPEEVKYVNSKGIKTKYELQARDFYYGFLRNLYAAPSIREKGNIQGYNKEIPLVSAEYEATLTGDYWKKLNNGNVYLNNLFGLNVKDTIDANEKNIKDNLNEFTIKFDRTIDLALIKGLLADNSTIVPVSSQKIEEMRPVGTTISSPGKYLQLKEHGGRKENNGKYDLSDELLISRYYVANFDTNKDTKGIVLKKNMYSFDKTFNSRTDTINEFQEIFYAQNIDKDVFRQDRKVSFLNDNSESIMERSVKEANSLLEEVIKSGKFIWSIPVSSGVNKSVTWLPYNFAIESNNLSSGSSPMNNGGLELFFGRGATKKNFLDSENTDYEYNFGSGNKMRAILDSVVNLYTLTTLFRANKEKIKNPMIFIPGTSMTVEGMSYNDYITAHPEKSGISEAVYVTKLADQKKWYEKHSNDKSGSDNTNTLLKPSEEQFNAAKKALVALFNSNVSDPSTPAIVPLFDEFYAEKKQPKEIIAAYDKLTTYLNTLAPGKVKFVKFEAKTKAYAGLNNKFSPTRYLAAGADYNSSGSLFEQQISATYGYSIGLNVIEAAFKDDENIGFATNVNPNDIYARAKSPALEHLKTWISSEIQKNPDKYPKLKIRINNNDLNKLTLEDFKKIKLSSFDLGDKHDKELNALYGEQNSLFGKYFISISSDSSENLILISQWTQFLTNFSGNNLLYLSNEKYAAMLSERVGEQPKAYKVYVSPWLHLSTPPSGTSYFDFQLHATRVDDK